MNNLSIEEVQKKYIGVITNLNQAGLEKMIILLDVMNDFELYNINTTPERLKEIKAEKEQEAEDYKKKCQEEREKASYEKAKEDCKQMRNKIDSLTGKDKKLFDTLEKLKSDPTVEKYCLSYHEMMLFANVYNNSLLSSCHELFLYGFMKGQRYEKNRRKRGIK